MSHAVSFQTFRVSEPFRGDLLLRLVFASPVVALVLAFGIWTYGEQGTVAQTAIEIASYQM